MSSALFDPQQSVTPGSAVHAQQGYDVWPVF